MDFIPSELNQPYNLIDLGSIIFFCLHDRIAIGIARCAGMDKTVGISCLPDLTFCDEAVGLFCVFLTMIQRFLFVVALMGSWFFASSQSPAGSQSIVKWKIEEVVKSYTANNDTVYVVNFWATFCKPCIEEIPGFIKLVEKYKSQKVKLLLVSLDLPSFVPVKLPAFIKKNNYKTNHAWLDETNADHFCPMIDEKWSGAIPSTIIVNNSNGYRKFVEDQMSAEEFESALKEAIGGNSFYKFRAPMNDAEVTDEEPQRASGAFVTFKSSDSSVYAVMEGKVSMIAKIDHMKVVIIEKDNFFYTYSNLGSTSLKTGDLIKTDQLIGYAAFDLDGYKPSVDLYLSDPETNIILSKKDFRKRNDIRLTDHSIDTIGEPK